MSPDLIVVMTCVSCGGDLEWIAQGKPGAQGSNIAAVGECTECGRSWVARVQLLSDGREGRGSLTKRKRAACVVCGQEMDAYYSPAGERGGKPRKTCSPTCARENWREKSLAHHATASTVPHARSTMVGA